MAAYLLIFLDSSDADAITMTALLVFFNSRYLIVIFFCFSQQTDQRQREDRSSNGEPEFEKPCRKLHR